MGFIGFIGFRVYGLYGLGFMGFIGFRVKGLGPSSAGRFPRPKPRSPRGMQDAQLLQAFFDTIQKFLQRR